MHAHAAIVFLLLLAAAGVPAMLVAELRRGHAVGKPRLVMAPALEGPLRALIILRGETWSS